MIKRINLQICGVENGTKIQTKCIEKLFNDITAGGEWRRKKIKII
jgi:hypothetical protein